MQSLPANANRSESSETSACKETPKTNARTGSTHSNNAFKRKRERGKPSKQHYRVNNSEKKGKFTLKLHFYHLTIDSISSRFGKIICGILKPSFSISSLLSSFICCSTKNAPFL